MKRRDFLRTGAAAAIGGAAAAACAPGRGTPAAAPALPRRAMPVGRARNVIFCVYDGFNVEDLAVGRYFAARHLGGRVLNLERLLGRGATGLMLTHSLDSIVTDSAAASAAWATGRKVANRTVSMLPDGRPLMPILRLAHESGRATGLITTARITHATPAAFVARVPAREMEDEIAEQYLEVAPEVLLGGGTRHFDPGARADGRDLFAEYRARGYGVVHDAEALAASNAVRVLGTFAAGHLPYEIDRRHQGRASPTLAEMTRRGLEILSGYDGGFVAQMEAGRIDHANHDNDPGAMLWDLLAADEALRVVLDFADRTPGTLVIFASDHGTGGGAVYGIGRRYADTNAAFDRLAAQRASYELLRRRLGPAPTGGEVREALLAHTGARLGVDQARRLADALAARGHVGHPRAHEKQPLNAFHQLATEGNERDRLPLNMGYAASAHTAGPVPVAVYGAGTGAAGLGVVDNTELFGWLLHALGIQHENPAAEGTVRAA